MDIETALDRERAAYERYIKAYAKARERWEEYMRAGTVVQDIALAAGREPTNHCPKQDDMTRSGQNGPK